MDILPPDGEPWSASMLALSRAEQGRYAPEFDCSRRRPVPAHREAVGMTD